MLFFVEQNCLVYTVITVSPDSYQPYNVPENENEKKAKFVLD